MNFGRSLVNVGLAALGGVLGNLLAGWVLQYAWGGSITAARAVATAAGFAAVILILALMDARTERRAAETMADGEVRDNVQIGRSVIRVMRGTNVVRNVQIGDNVIEVLNGGWTAPLAPRQQPDRPPETVTSSAPIRERDLRQQRMELEAQYAHLTNRIQALDIDLTQALDGERRLVLQQRRATLASQRDQVASELQRIESGLNT